MNDNISITIIPLDCSQNKSLGFLNNQYYLDMCIDYDDISIPTVYVNNKNALFNISGQMTILNVIFSGINAFVTETNATHDYSVLPI